MSGPGYMSTDLSNVLAMLTMTSSSRGINNELVMEMKGKARTDDTGATEVKGQGVCCATGTSLLVKLDLLNH